MHHVVLRIREAAPEPARAWTAELWSGFPDVPPGTPGPPAVRLGGGQTPFTQAQLEAPSAGGIELTQAEVLRAIREEEQEHQIFVDVGIRLYELLEATGVVAALNTCRSDDDAKPANERGLRLYLDLPQPLSGWPWELLAWKTPRGLFDPAFILERYPIVRLMPPAVTVLPAPEPTIRILLVSGQEQLDRDNTASAELKLIRRIFHQSNKSVVVEECEAPPTLEELEGRINDVAPHILHFIGHGYVDPQAQTPELSLVFKRAARDWSVTQIRQFFQNNWRPRLFVMNACHSSQQDRHSIPTADSLLDVGVMAVIGAQATLQIGAARRLSERLYTALAEGLPLDSAMARARHGLSTEFPQGNKRRHWALPVLTVTGPAAEILRFKRTDPSVMTCDIAREVYARPGRFVNRTADRRSLLAAFHPFQPGKPAFKGVILQSDGSEVGKDWLMKRSVRDFLDDNFMVRHATLVGLESRTSLDVLQEWRGLPKFASSPMGAPIPGPHFDEFDEAIAAARRDPTARNMEDVFRSFKSGLQQARQGRDVLLILARFRKWGQNDVSSRDFGEHILEKLLAPIARTDPDDPELAGVHALLVVRRHQKVEVGQASDFDEYGLQRLSAEVPEKSRTPADGFRRLQVSEFSQEQLEHHLDEFAEFIDDPAVEGLRMYIRAVVKSPSWRPQELNRIQEQIAELSRQRQ